MVRANEPQMIESINATTSKILSAINISIEIFMILLLVRQVLKTSTPTESIHKQKIVSKLTRNRIAIFFVSSTEYDRAKRYGITPIPKPYNHSMEPPIHNETINTNIFNIENTMISTCDFCFINSPQDGFDCPYTESQIRNTFICVIKIYMLASFIFVKIIKIIVCVPFDL